MALNTRIHHAAINTTNIEKARDFYGRILGLKELVRPPVGDGIWYKIGPTHEMHVTLCKPDEVPGPGRTLNPFERGVEGRHFAFAVDNLEEAKQWFTKNGVRWFGDNEKVRPVFVEDPDGNLLEINTGGLPQKLKNSP